MVVPRSFRPGSLVIRIKRRSYTTLHAITWAGAFGPCHPFATPTRAATGLKQRSFLVADICACRGKHPLDADVELALHELEYAVEFGLSEPEICHEARPGHGEQAAPHARQMAYDGALVHAGELRDLAGVEAAQVVIAQEIAILAREEPHGVMEGGLELLSVRVLEDGELGIVVRIGDHHHLAEVDPLGCPLALLQEVERLVKRGDPEIGLQRPLPRVERDRGRAVLSLEKEMGDQDLTRLIGLNTLGFHPTGGPGDDVVVSRVKLANGLVVPVRAGASQVKVCVMQGLERIHHRLIRGDAIRHVRDEHRGVERDRRPGVATGANHLVQHAFQSAQVD